MTKGSLQLDALEFQVSVEEKHLQGLVAQTVSVTPALNRALTDCSNP